MVFKTKIFVRTKHLKVFFFENMSWKTYLSHRRKGRRPIHNAKNGYNTPLIQRLATTHYNSNDTRDLPKLNNKQRHDQRQATKKNRPPLNSPRQCTSNP
jgi:hypothetical protein